MHVPSFALPWEVGMYWNLTVGGLNKRAMGCPGIDAPFGSHVNGQYNWPERRNSQTMKCGLNMYTPVDRPMHELIDELASDNELFAERFLEGWQMMTSNGYKVSFSTAFIPNYRKLGLYRTSRLVRKS